MIIARGDGAVAEPLAPDNGPAAIDPAERSIWARIGVSLLNLIFVGLGLIRIGRIKLALAFGLFATVMFGALVIFAGRLTFTSFVIYAIAGLVTLLGAIVTTFVLSRSRDPSTRFWRNGWGFWILIAGALVWAYVASGIREQNVRIYRASSASMNPTLVAGDRLIAMRASEYHRGDIVVYDRGDQQWVHRIAAIPGDKIQMRDGQVWINDVAVKLSPLEQIKGANGWPAQVYQEQFPGETKPHKIMDSTTSQFDNTPPLLVPAGHYFMLGDNRDSSADSRVPMTMGGPEMVKQEDVKLRAGFIIWGSEAGRSGLTL